MKTKWIASLILASALVTPAFAGVGVYIGVAPPPIRYEVRPAMPGPGYAWVDGYWNWYGGRYVWRPGVWQRPPYEGASWNHPHYDHYHEGWALHEGHWDHEDHGDHHDWGHR
jgi:WXXGXW repeat (2 copies)